MVFEVNKVIPRSLRRTLIRQRHHLVGNHSSVKKCEWAHRAMISEDQCYKNVFYGIQSHRCMQMTPSLIYCNHNCVFCWRPQANDFSPTTGYQNFLQAVIPQEELDSPEFILEHSLHEQRRLMVGYNPTANPKVTQRKYREALDPKHVAISLAGEPTLYPDLSSFIHLIKKRNMTAFLVTNGTQPEVLSSILEPTQLYVSLCASDPLMYQKICRPTNDGLWEELRRTLELLPSFSCPTVLRLTLVKGLNTSNLSQLKKLIQIAEPTYIEPKSYMAVGFARERLSHKFMLSPEELKEFAQMLAHELGYHFIADVPISRVALISKLKTPIRWT